MKLLMKSYSTLLTLTIVTTLFGVNSRASAADFPQTSVTISVPYSAGGGADVIARQVATELGKKWKKPVLVVNRPGANGGIATTYVTQQAPDGYNLLLHTTAITINQSLKKNVTFDVRRDLIPLTQLVTGPMGVYVHAGLPIRSIPELVSYAQKNPGKLNYGSAGIGGTQHLLSERLRLATGINIVHIPYASGSAAATTALMSGEVQLLIQDVASTKAAVDTGRVRLIGVVGTSRSSVYPDIPTMAESGVPGLANFNVSFWYGIFAPVRTPPELIELISRDIQAVLRDPAMVKRLDSAGYQVVGSAPDAFKKKVDTETDEWALVIQQAKIPVD